MLSVNTLRRCHEVTAEGILLILKQKQIFGKDFRKKKQASVSAKGS